MCWIIVCLSFLIVQLLAARLAETIMCVKGIVMPAFRVLLQEAGTTTGIDTLLNLGIYYRIVQ